MKLLTSQESDQVHGQGRYIDVGKEGFMGVSEKGNTFILLYPTNTPEELTQALKTYQGFNPVFLALAAALKKT